MSDTDAVETPQPVVPKPQAPQAEPNELPAWARKQISDANTEAAEFRVQLKEAKKASKELQDQIAATAASQAAAASSNASIQSDFDRLVTAIKSEVPHEHIFSFAKTLQGSNEEELLSHATELKSMFGISHGPVRAVDRSQGQGGEPKPATPAETFAQMISDQMNHRR